MLNRTRDNMIQSHLFYGGANVYAVLDGASIPDLLEKLYKWKPEHICLYRGELAPDLAEVAPYLVRLEQNGLFTEWVITQGWGHHWGIFAISEEGITTLRKHFRTILMVEDPRGKPVYFRYYDPRVLRCYLPSCHPDELKAIIGPINNYITEAEDPDKLLRFWLLNDSVQVEELKLSQAN